MVAATRSGGITDQTGDPRNSFEGLSTRCRAGAVAATVSQTDFEPAVKSGTRVYAVTDANAEHCSNLDVEVLDDGPNRIGDEG